MSLRIKGVEGEGHGQRQSNPGTAPTSATSVGVLQRPQSKPPDFYANWRHLLGQLSPWNRWGGFKASATVGAPMSPRADQTGVVVDEARR